MTDRGASVPINYTISIVIVTVLMTGLIVAASGQLDAQQERTAESDFAVLGNRMAADISAADRLAQTTENKSAGEVTVQVRTSIPDTSAGASYTIDVTSNAIGAGDAYRVVVTLESRGVDVSETIRLKTGTEVADATVTGGDYRIEYVDDDGDGDLDTLEVRND